MATYSEMIDNAAGYIRSIDSRKPLAGIILGSGLGAVADMIEDANIIPYSQIPGFPVSTAIGHKGNLIIGTLSGKTVVAMQGRFHYYEGYTMQQVTFPVRVMKWLGAEYLFVSNASGGLNPDYKVGDLMLIRDQINMAPSPLIGRNLDDFGPRFPDMGRPYDVSLMKKAKECAARLGIPLQEGIYVVVTGPAYETPAECRMYRLMGADAIGMSTVPEVIVARHCSLKVMGVSIITDEAHYDRPDDFVVDGESVVIEADKAARKMTSLFLEVLKML